MWTLVLLFCLPVVYGAIKPDPNSGCILTDANSKCLKCQDSYILLSEYSICISIQVGRKLIASLKQVPGPQTSGSGSTVVTGNSISDGAGNSQAIPAGSNNVKTNPNQLIGPDGIIVGCTYHSNGSCLKCANRYYLQKGLCFPISDQCKTWSSTTGSCLSCYNGYQLSQGDCTLARQREWTPVPGCLVHGEDGACVRCALRFYRDGEGGCQAVSSLCQSWNQRGACTSCYLGYRLKESQCVYGGEVTLSENILQPQAKPNISPVNPSTPQPTPSPNIPQSANNNQNPGGFNPSSNFKLIELDPLPIVPIPEPGSEFGIPNDPFSSTSAQFSIEKWLKTLFPASAPVSPEQTRSNSEFSGQNGQQNLRSAP